MTKIFDDMLQSEKLILLRHIFDQLCEDHDLTPASQYKRDALAVVLVAASQTTSDEAELKAAGTRAIINI